jgi:hypothetical protein
VIVLSDDLEAASADNFPHRELKSGGVLLAHVGRIEHCPKIADLDGFDRSQGPWGFWCLGQGNEAIPLGGAKSPGKRVDAECIHALAADDEMFNAGGDDTVETSRE